VRSGLLIFLSCVVSIFANQAMAQQFSADCEFIRICDVQFLCNADSFSLRLQANTETGEAFIEGNNGSFDATFVEGYAAISFMEVLLSGAVQTTNVTNGGHAIHSRHTTFRGDTASGMVPTQYRGTCNVSEWP
jgi:hypothetical protein